MTATTTPHTQYRTVQRLVMPADPTPDIVPLYVERTAARTGVTSAAASLGGSNDRRETDARKASHAPAEVVSAHELTSRHSLTVPPHELRSLATYFNAFPASYWRRWTPVRSVRLSIDTIGTGLVSIMRSSARGTLQRVSSHHVSGSESTVVDLPLTAFGDGGWYWFDVYAADEQLMVRSATWSVDESLARETGSLSISMTTMNKVSYCLDNIRTIAENRDLREMLDVMYVVDQGSDRLRDHDKELAPLQSALGAKLEIIEQGNIGGSGGFSRGMYEAATNGRSTYVVNCDDDIVIEPESLIRLKTFADFATRPTIVGAHMFDLNNRSVLHTFGEIVDPWRIQPSMPVAEAELGHDFATHPLRSTTWLHRRFDVDYNGWWMCLIPTQTVREIGLSLPVFIKWDDAEYGLRARKAGTPTVSLPGAGVWHMSWVDKDDLVGWQSYFHERNRIITALLHSPYERGGRVITESQFMDVKHLISMQYFTETGRVMAQHDVLQGPQILHEIIGTRLPEIRAMASNFDDAVAKKDLDDYPEVHMHKPPRRGRPLNQPRRALLPVWTAKTLLKQVAKAPRERAARNPEAVIAHQDAKWWRLSAYDSALVSNAEGTQISWHRRDPRKVRDMLAQAIGTHAELWRRWPELRREYQEAAQEITSFAAWEKTFRDNPAPPRKDASATEKDRTA